MTTRIALKPSNSGNSSTKTISISVRGEPAIGSISWLGSNWVHVRVQEIDNIVVKTQNFTRNLKI